MICPYCQKQNRAESKFCRFCGGDLIKTPSHSHVSSEDSHFQIRIPKNLFRKISPKIGLIILLIVALTGGTVYAAPKVNDFVKVRAAIQEAKEKQNSGEYQAAIDVLNKVEERWSLQSQKQELTTLKESQIKFIGYEQTIASSTEKENSGNFKEARDLLQQIGTDYPKYTDSVQPKLTELQEKVEQDLEAKATAATAAKVEAEKRAQAEAAAKARAQADAAAAAEAKARSDAAASAAAEQARQAEYQRQQEEAEKVRQVKISFLNQLSSIYKSFNSDGIDYYNDGMSYYNSGNELTAIAIFGQARAVFQNTYSQALSLNSNFSGMPSNYIQAGNDMKNAAYYALQATDEVISVIGTYSSSNANYYGDLAESYGSKVRSFLTSQGY